MKREKEKGGKNGDQDVLCVCVGVFVCLCVCVCLSPRACFFICIVSFLDI